MEYRFTSIMLRKREVRETDRFYTFFTRELGKVTAIARGVRKSEAKLASSLETATLAEIMVVRTRGIGKVTGAVLEQSYPAIHQSYPSLFEALRVLADVDRLVEPEERDIALFDVLYKYLEAAETLTTRGGSASQHQLLAEAARFQLFIRLGYQLELGVCVVSRNRLRSGDRFFISFEAGGIITEDHMRRVRDAQPISEQAIKALRLIMTQPIHHISKVVLEGETLVELSRLSTHYRRWIRD